MARLFGSDAELTAPVTRDCITCQLPLTPARLKAQPDAVQCVKCVCLHGDEPAVRGRMIYTHKTAPEIEIGTRLAAATPSTSYGVSIRLGSYKTAQDRHAAAGWLPLDGVVAIGAKPQLEPERVVHTVLNRHPARCHPDRPRIGPSGYCLPCAVAQQEKRVLHARA